MPAVPSVTGTQVVRALEKVGFSLAPGFAAVTTLCVTTTVE